MLKEQLLHFDRTYPQVSCATQALLGSVLMGILAQITIPMQPVPMSLQTLGVFLLPFMMNKRAAVYSMILYLFEATLGLPILSSMKVNPFWIVGPTAGYLLSFPVAAFVIGWLLERKSSQTLLWSALSLVIGQAVIYASGVAVLALYIGLENAFFAGFLPFLPIGIYKVGLALAASKVIQKIL